ncbi:uncharacterized protein HaLaN_19308 [Haematococcus lacustris]|uniref:NADH dehydrogenase [ubiquinone] 1 alpha subcomplex subunit 13 n=1 Tax=Haematococcus lacustris TaxID=44745 RepID=A0A6A0A011_HAELA|nr:uncharacterized protein HaLaN_19308 [Haematococcus lacustris]
MTEFLKRGRPGLASIKDLPVLQDAPPPGGFPNIRIERRLPNTGPTGVAIFGVVAALMGYGFYQLYERKTNVKYLEHKRKETEKEAEIMKKVNEVYSGKVTK